MKQQQRRGGAGGGGSSSSSSTKNPPILSHEFVIQNHADIVAFFAMAFVFGLMFQVSSSVASVFITLSHSVTTTTTDPPSATAYTCGLLDIPATFFYFLIAIVLHQIIQEYLLDKVNRKLHLSKVKHAKFNESGQLLAFYTASLLWAGDIVFVRRDFNSSDIRSLWEGYPHTQMSYMFKFFFITQISYWFHVFPELYFQRIKREDMTPKITLASLHLVFIIGAYVLSYTRVALCLLFLQYFADAVFHLCRILSYLGKLDIAKPFYIFYDIVFVLSRLGSISLAVLTFWYGLAQPKNQDSDSFKEGNYSGFIYRLNILIAVCFLQAVLMWNFITFQIRLKRERAVAAANNPSMTGKNSGSGGKTRSKPTQREKASKRKEKAAKNGENDDVNELTEVDQNTKKNIRQRK